MSYKPLTKEEAMMMSHPQLIEDGTYQCELVEFSHTDKYHNPLKDRNGEDMTRIKLKIWDINGKEKYVFTNLFWGNNNKMSYRTRHFAESFKAVEMYESGKLFDCFRELLGHTGHCEIYTQNARPKNDGSNDTWPAKNDVRDFIVVASSNKKQEEFINDDVPF